MAEAAPADTLGSVLAAAAAALAKAGCLEPRRRARRLVASALEISAAELLIDPDRMLDRTEASRLVGLVDRMTRGEPLSRVLGRREFWGLEFELSAATLDPRPESEILVETVLSRIADRGAPLRVLDLGTGSGCLLLALLSELPAATGVGVDISEGAIRTARRNAKALRLDGRVRFFVGDWTSALAQRFDVVVANPPYVATAALSELPREVSRYDPRRALDGGEDGLAAYRQIAKNLLPLLTPFAVFAAEVGAGQAVEVAAIVGRCGLFVEATERDLAGIERCVVARRTVGEAPGQSIGGQKSLGMCGSRV
jgi:release factor glutamine methyltransferase